MITAGNLFIVATPIGNLSDITLRALEILKQVDLIAAEDTRHSKKLLDHYGITTPTISLHNYNEVKKCQLILEKLESGKNIALISDAGTPLISDPGFHLVKTVQEKGIKVIPIPGACAATAALSASGLPTDKFIFEGFLPVKSSQQLERLKVLAEENRTIIFYEAPHRILATIKNMEIIFGQERAAVLAKELTKTFETILSGTLLEIENWLADKAEHQKGEFVILVKGVAKSQAVDAKTLDILKLLSKTLPHKQAVVLTAEITGVSKNLLYKISLDSYCK